MSPKVSVILPFFNADKTLQAAIDSILNQTFTDFELLLVDNNSTDTSLEIANANQETDRRVKLVSEKKQGVAFAMNKGLELSIGEYIARMDGDDISLPERLEKQVNFLDENTEIGLIGSTVKFVPHIENSDGFQRFVNWANSFHSPKEIELNRFIEIPVVNPTILFRREIFEKYGGCFEGDFPEDYEMLLRYLNAGIQFAKLPEKLLEWHDFETRLTRSDRRYSTEAFFRIKAKYFNYWSEKNNPFHPDIWIWGAGRKARQRAKLQEKEGMNICGFIDIIESKTTKKTTLHFSEIPPPGKIFIVPMVAKYGAREKIESYLKGKGYKAGKNYMVLA